MKDDNKDLIKKLIKFLIIFIVVVVVLMLILIVPTMLVPKTYDYEGIENIMVNAAKKYYSSNKDYLPIDNYGTTQVDYATLVDSGYMKTFDEYSKSDDEVCTSGYVVVQKTDSNYLYVPYLSCGTSYTTETLVSKLTGDDNVVSTGDGLYYDIKTSTYAYRGENVDNYVTLNDITWRIVKITSQGNILLITNDKVGYSTAWDDRYNSEKLYGSGVNDFSISRMRDKLDDIYETGVKTGTTVTEILDDDTKSYMVPYDLCIAKRSTSESSKDTSVECSEKLENQMVGLITMSDYMHASLDEKCSTTVSKECQNYNYLDNDIEFWTITASKENTYDVFSINRAGYSVNSAASTYSNIRPTIMLNARVLYDSGDGSEEKPYKIKTNSTKSDDK